jgi:hypothetical protein
MEKTILRILGSCTFLRSQGHLRTKGADNSGVRSPPKNEHRQQANVPSLLPPTLFFCQREAKFGPLDSSVSASVASCRMISATGRISLIPPEV